MEAAVNPLTREMIDAGAIDAMVARDAPSVLILSESERTDSLLRRASAR